MSTASSQADHDPTPPKRRDWAGIWMGIATIAAIGLAGLPGLAAFLALGSSNQQVKQQLQIAEQGQITDRFNAAITNLGSPSVDVRLGGIYALQRIMQDSSRDQPTVVAVLCAFVRDHAPAAPAIDPAVTTVKTDVQAALTVVDTRDTAQDGSTTVVDLSDTNLANADLSGANLSHADLSFADLSDATLTHTDLSGANRCTGL